MLSDEENLLVKMNYMINPMFTKKRERMILEIIADAGELKERASSYEIQINREIEKFLVDINCDYLIEHFEGHPDLTLKDLSLMSDS